MISYGKSVGLKSLNLNTNGLLMSADLADRILESGLDVIVFGVDGYSSSTYGKIRVGGDRTALYENIENLLTSRSTRKKGPDIQVQFIEMDENKHELENFKNHWLAKGAVVKVRRKLSWGGRIETPLVVREEMRIPCPWAISLMHVLWDGRVARCAGDTEADVCVGNAWEDSLFELWGRLEPYRQMHLERRFGDLPEICRHCKDWMTGASERIRPQEKPADLVDRLRDPGPNGERR
jgi:MoaA/NifB/PqqE/SkfB family radical SAM enzyme